jgi:HEAT repeat protein
MRVALIANALVAVAVASAARAENFTDDEQLLKAAHLKVDGPALLDFFRSRSVPDAEPDAVAALIRRLGDNAAEVRDPAFAGLVSLGPAAVVGLRQAANDLDDADVATNARKCLQWIEGDAATALVKSAARLLSKARPEATAEVLLAYLPFAEDADTVREIEVSLAAVALRDRQPDATLLKALQDPRPVCRAAAAEALCLANDPRLYIHVRPLMKDPKPTVRLRVALSLARKHDVDAIPVLIDLLSELAPPHRHQAEEFLSNLAGEWAVVTPQGNDETARQLRRELWTAWWKATDEPGLLAEFRKRTPSDAQREEIEGLIRRLGETDPAVRDEAMTRLVAMGGTAVPLLRLATENENSGIRLAASNCLQLIQNAGTAPMPVAAARLVALRKPPGAAEALLAYLPWIDTDGMAQEVRVALAAVAFRDGEANPVLRHALAGASPIRRAAAAEAFCLAGVHDQRDAVRQLLNDTDLGVRLRVALALTAAHDKHAVPALIALVGELPADRSWPAEEMLIRLAGDKAPSGTTAGDVEARNKYRDAWLAWWNQHGETTDLARLDRASPALGLTLVVEQQSRRAGRVLELDQAGKVRWQIDGLQQAVDAQALPGDRVLVVEQQAGRVTERDRNGKIIWQRPAPNPVTAQRLPNGQTFIAMRQQLVVVDREGKETFSHNRPAMNIASAARTRDGHYSFVTYEGQYVQLDATGKEVKNVSLPLLQNYAQFVEFLPNERLLVAMHGNNKVAEYDLNGKVLWEANVQSPTSASRLPNGNTLVVSTPQRIVELNRAGQTVWEVKQNIRPWKARRR